MIAERRRLAVAPPAVVVTGVTKSFPVAYGIGAWLRHRGRPPRRVVLTEIDLTVGKGELVGLLGPNGAGKTTLLKLLATLSIPDQGRILIDGIDVVREPLEAKQKVGLCANEERSFFYRLTARENLAFFGTLAGLRGRSLERRIRDVVEIVDLHDSLDRRFGTYSSGMRQRLTVARALLGDPDVVFLDEPTRAVDPVHADELRRFFRARLIDDLGKTVILATNLLDEAWELCDRVAVLNHGRIVALGPPRTLDGGLHRIRRFEIGLASVDDALVEHLRRGEGCASVEVTRAHDRWTVMVMLDDDGPALDDLLRTLAASRHPVVAFTSIEADPMDVFKEVTRNDDVR